MWHSADLENFHTPPGHWKFMVCTFPHPSGNSSLAAHFPLQILAFNTTAPLPHPLEFPVILHGVGMDIFLKHKNDEIYFLLL